MIPGNTEIPFAFIRPLWLLGLLALPVLGWTWRRLSGAQGWENYIDPLKLKYLSVETQADRSRPRAFWIGSLAVALLGLAGPSWRTIPLPLEQTRNALVIAFDLSPSMLATDIKPDRLTRARLKIIDLLRLRTEGETALIAYADDAYRVSPLTDDTATIEALVPSLHPDVMPGPGSQVEAAVAMARQLLTGASRRRGAILIVTDGIDPSAIDEIEKELGDSLQLCILGVGSSEGVPIPIQGGGFARDQKNQIILANLDRTELENLADRHGGCYSDLRTDDTDLESIQAVLDPEIGDDFEASKTTFDVRQDEGYWLVLILLPFAAFCFRRHVLWIGILGFAITSISPSPSEAFEWADLWQRTDQREGRRLEAGVEHYRHGDYAGAAEDFVGSSSLQHYNRANALALAGQLEQAIESYDQVLDKEPDRSEALFNREIVEKLLEDEKKQSQSHKEDPQDPAKNDDSSGEEANSDSQQSRNREPQDDADDSPQDANSATPRKKESDGSEPSETEKASMAEKQDSSEASAEAGEEEPEPDARDSGSARAAPPEAEPLSDRSEQWLRSIPEDPGGLMRRKFQYQAQTRRQRGARSRSGNRY